MSGEFKVITPDFINLVITSSGGEYACTVERRFPKSLTITELKGKLELQTGGNASTMSLELYDKEDKLVTRLDDNEALLGAYPADNGMRLHVVDKFLLRNEFEDVSKVDKFDLPIGEYNKRSDTVKAFLQQNKLGKYNEAEMAARAELKKKEEEIEREAAEKCHIDDRCETNVPGQPKRRGVVKYIGEAHFSKGCWVGVQYDEPLGKNNGTVDGKKYFECPPKYGGFVRPIHVTTGDFPELEFDIDEEI